MKPEFLDKFSINNQIQNFTKTLPLGVELFHANSRTDTWRSWWSLFAILWTRLLTWNRQQHYSPLNTLSWKNLICKLAFIVKFLLIITDKNSVYITDKIHEADPLLWEVNRNQLTKKFRAIYETKNLTPLFSTACNCQPGKSNLHFHIQCENEDWIKIHLTIIHQRLGHLSTLFLSGLPIFFMSFSSVPCVLHALPISSMFFSSKYLVKSKIMKFRIFFTTCSHFSSLWCKNFSVSKTFNLFFP